MKGFMSLQKRRDQAAERLARDICWAYFNRPSKELGYTKTAYWKGLPESTRQNYRAEAQQFAYLASRLGCERVLAVIQTAALPVSSGGAR
jgi:hypothetical protein